MTGKVFVYIWEFFVKEGCRSEFKKYYGPEGDWVLLFRKAKGYISTDLHQDISNVHRFITVDSWNSKEDRDNFQKEYSNEFELLDKQCERFTEHEHLIGNFESFVGRC
jgi:quinol monooxygenase YgiN